MKAGTGMKCGNPDDSIKVSVIVPVYNVADYLRKCIESIIRQTLKEIEIILIDDGATDASGRICDSYAARDSRIKVIHKSNGGLSVARNAGLDAASAPYIMFVDSDDYVEPNFCELPYRRAVETGADLVLFSFCKVLPDGRISKQESKFRSGFLSEFDALRFNFQFAPAIWLGCYRRELFDGIRFPAGKYHEDTGTKHRLIHAADRIFFAADHLYYYRSGRKGSIITTPETRNHIDRREMLFRRINDLCEWGYEPLAWNDAFYLLIRYGCRGDEQKPLTHIVNGIKGYPADFDFKRKALLVVFRLSPVLFDIVCIVLRRQLSK